MNTDRKRARQGSFRPLPPRLFARHVSFRRIFAARDAAVLRGATRDAAFARAAPPRARLWREFQFVNACGYVDNLWSSTYSKSRGRGSRSDDARAAAGGGEAAAGGDPGAPGQHRARAVLA